MIDIYPFGCRESIPFAITVNPAAHGLRHSGLRPHNSRKARMTVEQKLLLCTLLQALAERDPRFVVTEHHGERGRRDAARLSAEAREFCDSDDFLELCREVGISAALLRRGTPAQAYRALNLLQNERINLEEAIAAIRREANLSQVRTETVPARAVEAAPLPLLEMRVPAELSAAATA
jgi:hypothetical protein